MPQACNDDNDDDDKPALSKRLNSNRKNINKITVS